jgi:hypothetical protein
MVRRYEQGRSLNQVAREFRCSPNTVTAALIAADVARRPSGGRRTLTSRWGTWFRGRASNGYIIWSAWDTERKNNRCIGEHRIIMSWMLGRELLPGETVHHKDGDRTNNDPSNLELWVRQHPAGMSHCPHCGRRLTEDRTALGSPAGG